MRTELALAALVLVACEPAVRPPPVPPRDAYVEPFDAGDAGGMFTIRDAGSDTGPVDATVITDAPGPDGDGGAPARTPTIDGTIDDDEWAGALEATAMIPALPPYEGDSLTRVLALRTATRLYVAVEGTIEPTHAITMYVDADFGSDTGVLLVTGNELSDDVGVLDRAISAELYETFSGELRPDYAWGTTMMPVSIVGSTDAAGWREIASTAGSYVLLASANNTTCSATACETSIALGVGGIVGAGGTLALFLRAVDMSGFLSNQTLPLETGSGPEIVQSILLVPDPATLDGGT